MTFKEKVGLYIVILAAPCFPDSDDLLPFFTKVFILLVGWFLFSSTPRLKAKDYEEKKTITK